MKRHFIFYLILFVSKFVFAQSYIVVSIKQIEQVSNPAAQTSGSYKDYNSGSIIKSDGTKIPVFLSSQDDFFKHETSVFAKSFAFNSRNWGLCQYTCPCRCPQDVTTISPIFDSNPPTNFPFLVDGQEVNIMNVSSINDMELIPVGVADSILLKICNESVTFEAPKFIKNSNKNLTTYKYYLSKDNKRTWQLLSSGSTITFNRNSVGYNQNYLKVISESYFISEEITFKFSEPSVELPTIIKNNLCSYDTASLKITNNTSSFYNVTPTIHFNKNEYQALTSGDLNNNGTIIYNDLRPGNYTLEYKILDGCPITKSFTISPKPTALLVDTVSTKRLTCNASQDGEMMVDATGGSPYDRVGYEFSFDNLNFSIQPDLTFTNLKANNYTLYVRDKNNCIATFPNIIISEPKPLQLKAITTKNITCFGGSDGSVTLEALGGNGSYSYTLGTTTQQSALFTGLKSGSYTFTVTDAKQCSTSFNTSLTQALDFTPKAINVISPSCFGLKEAGFTVSVTGPTTYQYQYKLDSDVATSNSLFAGILGGNHNLSVKNQFNCEKKIVVTIPQPDEIVLKTTLVQPTCVYDKTGSITASATGGSGIKQYAFEQGSFGAQNSFSALSAGVYTIQVKDEKGCSQQFTPELAAKSNIKQTFELKAPLCYESQDGEIKTTTTGGVSPYVYKWLTTKDTLTVSDLTQIGAGTYYLQTKDKLGCVKFDTLNLIAPKAFSVFIPGHDVLCKNQEMLLDAGYPDLKHSWFKNGVLLTENTSVLKINEAGNYSVKIENETGCKGSFTKEIKASTKSFDADFLVSTNVAVGEEVILICNQDVDQLFWNFDKQTLKSKKIDDYTEEVVFYDQGDYTIKMNAFKDECFSSLTRTIHVYDPKKLRDKDSEIGYKPSLVTEAVLFPNPTLSDFTLKIT